MGLISSRPANASSHDEKQDTTSPSFEEGPPPYDSKASETSASPEAEAMLKSRQRVQDIFDKVIMKDIGRHPTYTAAWAFKNRRECASRLHNVVRLYLAIEYNVSPRPVVSQEDQEFFKRLIVFLLAHIEHANSYGQQSLKNNRKGEVDLAQYEDQVFHWPCRNMVARLNVRNRVLGLLWAHQPFSSSSPGNRAPAGYADGGSRGGIHSATNETSGYTPHNFRVSGTNRFFMDSWAAKGEFGRITEIFDQDAKMINSVFPKADSDGRATALVNLKAMQKLYFEDISPGWFAYDDDKGGFRQGSQWGWKLTQHAKKLLLDKMVRETEIEKEKEMVREREKEKERGTEMEREKELGDDR
jgi:hypothetical protein